MRLHITSQTTSFAISTGASARRRSGFIARAVRLALEDETRWDLIESSLGSIDDESHVWDGDLAAWVHEGRRLDTSRVG